MIRVGYLRHEIELQDKRCPHDLWANEIHFLARPTYRNVDIVYRPADDIESRFAIGAVSYDQVLKNTGKTAKRRVVIPDVLGNPWRYDRRDMKQIRYWMTKFKSAAESFAYQVVESTVNYPELTIDNPALRLNYVRLIEHEIMRVMDGKSTPKPTVEEPWELDTTKNRTIPELVAAELVRDIMEPEHFKEFCTFDCVTMRTDSHIFRIPRRSHAMIEVWDKDGKPLHRLCVVFKDPGMPPSDEVAMKYLLIKHQIDSLWQIAVKFGPPAKNFVDTNRNL